MADALKLLRLLQCNDSSFPSGSFAFSNGLETLVREERIQDHRDISDILSHQIIPRWMSFDRFFVSAAFDCGDDLSRLRDVDTMCHQHNIIDILAASSRRIGRSLIDTHSKIGTPNVGNYRSQIVAQRHWDCAGHDPVVQGLISFSIGLEKEQAEIVALNNTMMAVISACIRLGKLGAIEAQRLLMDISKVAASELLNKVAEQPASFSLLTDIATTRKSATGASLFST